MLPLHRVDVEVVALPSISLDALWVDHATPTSTLPVIRLGLGENTPQARLGASEQIDTKRCSLTTSWCANVDSHVVRDMAPAGLCLSTVYGY